MAFFEFRYKYMDYAPRKAGKVAMTINEIGAAIDAFMQKLLGMWCDISPS
jgi:hypothetical protein